MFVTTASLSLDWLIEMYIYGRDRSFRSGKSPTVQGPTPHLRFLSRHRPAHPTSFHTSPSPTMSYAHGPMDDDDFANLVKGANPAMTASSSSAYPPQGHPQQQQQQRTSNPFEMDPFFDDDDDQTPNPIQANPFTTPGASVSTLPLSKGAVPPAGSYFQDDQWDKSTNQPQQQKQWTFDADDDDVLPQPGTIPRNAPIKTKRRFNFQLPWGKKKVLAPERKIWLNDREANEGESYCSNYVSTTKYNAVTFMPKFLAGGFYSRLAFWAREADGFAVVPRTILEIRQRFLPLHRCAYQGLPSNSRADTLQLASNRYRAYLPLTNGQPSSHWAWCSWHPLSRKRRKTSFVALPSLLHPQLFNTLFSLLRNVVNPTPISTPAKHRSCNPTPPPSPRLDGATSESAMSCDWNLMQQSPRILFSSRLRSPRGYATSKHPTWTARPT